MEKKKITDKRRQQLRKARDKYNAKTYHNFLIHVRKDDEEILTKLKSVDSRNGYILDLIREDIKRNSK